MTDEQQFWLVNALFDHKYSIDETALALGVPESTVETLRTWPAPKTARWAPGPGVKVLPYPGGRHPRIGFLEGAINPERGTKASVFAPWDQHAYAVVDVPEAIFSNLGLLYLAHTHVPTIWSEKGVTIPPVDWTRNVDGSMEHQRILPNGVAFGARIAPRPDGADMEMWLRNGTPEPLTGLRTQVCVMLKGVAGFNGQTNDNKVFDAPVAYTKADGAERYALTAWDHCTRVWGNQKCPCMHSDPTFPDCAPGETVRVRGRIVFVDGAGVEGVVRELKAEFGG
ncbi:MAG: hypothetical protein HZB26_13455 [Candidatus Hydrogenedentes bacterium]|nr:hypothetical protein [Candidatus Hydrogenedentota bacterium]